MLYIWKIERLRDMDWGQYVAAVVVAATEADARRVHPDFDPRNPSDNRRVWPVIPEELKCTCVGVAAEGYEAGTVIMAIFVSG